MKIGTIELEIFTRRKILPILPSTFTGKKIKCLFREFLSCVNDYNSMTTFAVFGEYFQVGYTVLRMTSQKGIEVRYTVPASQ